MIRLRLVAVRPLLCNFTLLRASVECQRRSQFGVPSHILRQEFANLFSFLVERWQLAIIPRSSTEFSVQVFWLVLSVVDSQKKLVPMHYGPIVLEAINIHRSYWGFKIHRSVPGPTFKRSNFKHISKLDFDDNFFSAVSFEIIFLSSFSPARRYHKWTSTRSRSTHSFMILRCSNERYQICVQVDNSTVFLSLCHFKWEAM